MRFDGSKSQVEGNFYFSKYDTAIIPSPQVSARDSASQEERTLKDQETWKRFETQDDKEEERKWSESKGTTANKMHNQWRGSV